MPATVGTSGGNKDLTEIHIGTSGGNKQVTEGWIGTSGGNKQFYSSSTSSPVSFDGGGAISFGSGTQNAGITFSSSGNITFTSTSSGSSSGYTWYTPVTTGIGNLYEIQFVLDSGDTPSGSPMNTWLSLSSNRSVSLQAFNDSGSSYNCSLTISVREASTGIVQDSAPFTIYVANITV